MGNEKKKNGMEQDVLCRCRRRHHRLRRNSAYTFNFLIKIKKKSVFLQFFRIFLCWRAKHKKENSGQEICVCAVAWAHWMENIKPGHYCALHIEVIWITHALCTSGNLKFIFFIYFLPNSVPFARLPIMYWKRFFFGCSINSRWKWTISYTSRTYERIYTAPDTRIHTCVHLPYYISLLSFDLFHISRWNIVYKISRGFFRFFFFFFYVRFCLLFILHWMVCVCGVCALASSIERKFYKKKLCRSRHP